MALNKIKNSAAVTPPPMASAPPPPPASVSAPAAQDHSHAAAQPDLLKKYEKKFGMFGSVTRKINIYVGMMLGALFLANGFRHLFVIQKPVGGDAYNFIINRGSIAGAFAAAICFFVLAGIYIIVDLRVAKIQIASRQR